MKISTKISAKILSLSLFLLGGAFFVFSNAMDAYRLQEPQAKVPSPAVASAPEPAPIPAPSPALPLESPLPNKVQHELIFYPQAPDANWDEPWQETCEEASVALALAWLSQPEMSKDSFRAELLKMVDWQKEHFGDYKHSSAEQTITMMQSLYPETFGKPGSTSKVRLREGANLTELYESLASGAIILAPFDGKALQNPNFTNGGPAYHMSVMVGYHKRKNMFYVHDVGTRKGEYYQYPSEIILESLHDWSDAGIPSAPARWIEVLPQN